MVDDTRDTLESFLESFDDSLGFTSLSERNFRADLTPCSAPGRVGIILSTFCLVKVIKQKINIHLISIAEENSLPYLWKSIFT